MKYVSKALMALATILAIPSIFIGIVALLVSPNGITNEALEVLENLKNDLEKRSAN